MPPKRSRKKLVVGLVLLATLGYGAHRGYDWFVEGRFLVSTDDAYVRADTSILAAKVTGYVQSVAAGDNAYVAAGQTLALIDDGDYRLAVTTAKDRIATQEATVARIGEQARAQEAGVAQADAQIQAAKADSLRASQVLERSEQLARNDYATKASLDAARADRDRTAANVAAAEAAGRLARASIDVLRAQRAEAERARGEMQTALAKAERDLSFTQIVAPFAGTVGNRAIQAGQYVQPGTRLMALVPLESAYVEANFKETQIGGLKPGQKVEIEVDALGARRIEGVVEALAPASGAQFSLLPPENATGNFTKIVQRIPVRIRVPEEVAREGVLRPGLSVTATVHTRDAGEPRPSLVEALGLTALAQAIGAKVAP